MPTRINVECYLDKATFPFLITPDRLEEIFLDTFPSDIVKTLKKEPVKPYTITYVDFYFGEKKLITNFSVEITILNDHLLNYISAFLSLREISFPLGDVYITKIRTKSIEEEDFKDFLQNVDLPQQLMFEFLTPSILLREGLNYLLPDPAMVFEDVLKKWNRFSNSEKISIEKEWFIRHLETTAVFIKTKHVEIPNHPYISGFYGKVFVDIHSKSKTYLNQLHALRRFAEYCHIGKNAHWGFGKVQII